MLTIPKKDNFYTQHKTIFIALLSLILLIVFAFFSFKGLSKKHTLPPTYSLVELGLVQSKVLGQGRLRARQKTTLITEVEGIITRIVNYPGTEVYAGNTLILLKNPSLLRLKDKAELEVLKAKAEHRSNIAKLEGELLSLINNVDIAENDLKFAQQEMSMLSKLLTTGGVAKLKYVRAKNRLDKVSLQLTLAKRTLAVFKKTKIELVKATEYRLMAAEKELTLAQYDISKLAIKATKQGLLTSYESSVELGNLLSKGEPLGQVTDEDSLFVDFFISANDGAKVLPGQQVEIDIRGLIVTGEVLRIHPNVENNLVRIEATINEELPSIARDNIEVFVKVITQSIKNTLRVKTPQGLVNNKKQQDFFISKNNAFYRRHVQIGIVGKDYTQILAGLSENERVVTNPNSILEYFPPEKE